MRYLIALLISLVVAGCGGYGPAPSDKLRADLPEDAEIITLNGNDRYYKSQGCLIHDQWRYDRWTTVGVDCGD